MATGRVSTKKKSTKKKSTKKKSTKKKSAKKKSTKKKSTKKKSEEDYFTEAAEGPLTEWLGEEHHELLTFTYVKQASVAGLKGRPDAILVGMDEDGSTITLSVEAKSMNTLRELVTAYDEPGHFNDTALMGVLAGLAAGAVPAAIAVAVNLLFRRARYSTSRATAQALGYPGDYRVLIVPDDLLLEHEDLVADLAKVCSAWNLGLVISDRVDAEVLVAPSRHRAPSAEEWIDCYAKAEEVVGDLWAVVSLVR